MINTLLFMLPDRLILHAITLADDRQTIKEIKKTALSFRNPIYRSYAVVDSRAWAVSDNGYSENTNLN